MPSNAAVGPVMPACANSAAFTPERTAAAVATPFHIASSPLRVWRVAMFAVMAMASASPVCAMVSFNNFDTPAAVPSTANTP